MDQQEIIVIGSGFGGLAAAARRAAQGHRVTMYEKRNRPGGRAYQYEIDGFKFDGGPTVITAPYMFDEIWQMAGKRRDDYFELLPLNPTGLELSHIDYQRYNMRADQRFTYGIGVRPGAPDFYNQLVDR